MIKKIGIFIGGGLVIAAAGAGIATGIILPKALKAKEGLENFVANGGSYNSLSNKDKINIVTIGDSESAGAVGYLGGREERSYADFLAKSFKNAGKLGEYHNFAKSGERLSDIKRDVFEDPYVMRQIAGQKDQDGNKIKGTGADLITLSIGANDIIAYLKLFHFPFYGINDFLKKTKSGTISKSVRPGILKDIKAADGTITQKVDFLPNDKTANEQWRRLMSSSSDTRGSGSHLADKERTEIFGDNPGLSHDRVDSYYDFVKSIDDLKNMFAGKNQSLLNLDKDWFPKIYDLVKREMTVLVRDLHKVNPDAQIIVLGHAFPFGQLNEGVINNKKPELDNTSLKENFGRLLDSMKEGAEQNIDGHDSKFVSFYKVDEFAKFNARDKKLNFSNSDTFKKSVIGNTMPNIGDIHPSILGYDMIGESLYDIYGKEAGIKNIAATTQHSYPANTKDDPKTPNVNEQLWARIDEANSQSITNEQMWEQRYIGAKSFYAISNIKSFLNGKIAKLILPLINELLSKDNNIKITDTTDKMIKKIATIFKPAVLKSFGGMAVIKPIVKPILAPLFSKLEEMGNTVGAVKTQLKEGLKDDGVTEIEMFKLSQWGFYTVFQKLLSAQIEIKKLLSNEKISALLNQ